MNKENNITAMDIIENYSQIMSNSEHNLRS